LRLEVLLRRKNWPTLIDNKQLQNKGIEVAKSWWKSQIVIIQKALRENLLVYVEGTLYPSISVLEIGRDIMPTSQGWDGNYA
jgi:hypothetical protein